MTRLEKILLLVLFVLTAALRFPHLGYSDYIGDEHKAFFQPKEGQSTWNFFMEQRKGPAQFAVSYIPYMFTGDWRNELAERVPFTIFNVASVFVFYALIRRLTNGNFGAAFLGAALLSVNGFIVGFSRIAQYQNLNLFFSFLALYLYAEFLRPGKNLLRNTLFGTLAFAISVLSHWDTIFVLVPAAWFFVSFLLNKSQSTKSKVQITLANFALGSILLLPFLIPYVNHQLRHEDNARYFERRVSTQSGSNPSDNFEFLFHVYNPFFAKEFLIGLAIIGALFFRRTWVYVLWFAFNLAIFEFFVKKPGTHIYNFVFPAIFLGAVGMGFLMEKLPKALRALAWFGITASLAFLTYQSFMIFVDHKVEYPWRREELLGGYFKTREYKITDVLPLFGFPLSRGWNEINDFVNEQNRELGENFGYQTNEVKTISEWYMDAGYKSSRFYAIGVKRPLSFVNDWNFPQHRGKKLVKEFRQDDEVVVRIWRVE